MTDVASLILPRFSAVIPTYNRALTLGRAIRSVLDQELRASEVIVVDDGSVDSTQQLVASFGPQVRYLYQPNSGVAAARNAGALASHAQWIAFLDSDDVWTPSHLKNLSLAIVATDARASCYFSDVMLPGNKAHSTYWQHCGFDISGAYSLNLEPSDWVFVRIQPMLLQASAIRRDSLFDVGAVPAQLRTREDTLLFFKLALRYPMCAVGGCGAVWMDDGQSRLTRIFGETHPVYHLATISMYRDVLRDDVFPDAGRRTDVRKRLADALLTSGFVGLRQGNFADATKNVVAGFRVAPGFSAYSISARVGRRLTRGMGRRRASSTRGNGAMSD